MSLFGPPNVARLEAKGDAKGLMRALGDRSAGQVAAKALARIGAAPEPLTAALNDRDEVRRGNAWQALQELGPPAVPAVATALKSGTPEVRRIAARILGKIGHPQAIVPLAVALSDPDYLVRDWAAASLAAYSTPVVSAALKDQSEDVRRVAAEAIAKRLETVAAAPARAEAMRARAAASVKQLQGVLVMTPRPLNNAQQLLEQIVDEQKAMGHAAAPGFVATTDVGDVADQQYVYATIRTAFESFGGADVIDRTNVKTFQASDGNSGSYFLLFDRA